MIVIKLVTNKRRRMKSHVIIGVHKELCPSIAQSLNLSFLSH